MNEKLSSHENNFKQIKRNFEEQEEVMQKIYQHGARQHFESIPDLAKAFSQHDHWIRCIDDRTPGGYHSAGSGILRDEEEALAAFQAAGVRGVTSHDNCGAAALFAKAHGLIGNTDDYGRQWSKKIADKLGVPYQHLKVNTPHNARICYYDGTGLFDFTDVDGLLPGFIISRKIQDATTSIKEAKISATIALGEHGFGHLITKPKPFLILVIDQQPNKLAEYKEELAPLAKQFNGLIKIDGFLAPEFK